MNPELSAITDWIASNKQIAAPVAAFLVAWLLYGVLGKRFLGADDDFWPRVRQFIIPRLDRLARGTPGLYAEGHSGAKEYAGYHIVRLDSLKNGDDAIDPFERDLVMMNYGRNPLAAFKRSPQGWKSDGSWARRYGYVRGVGDTLRRLGLNASRVPVDPRWLAGMVGRFVQGLGDILALRQVHVTLYVEEREKDGIARIHCYVHDEPNSLNPLTALSHYQAQTWKAQKGVLSFQDDCNAHGVSLQPPSDQ